ncbi:TPA: tRNA pseudouridine(13) synthase TruD [Candidatus Woesearchaeota archaeon]|nr:tRNA pseudouridine(13) synthase TruD [Candidatus Woesearchaeota archaeon]HII64219.1 tRNA pseudouridine(13) synthase TruD [Candidatus Woesearchaeota archaeon]
MHALKHFPEDFAVREIPLGGLSDTGEYAVFEMRKRNYTTQDALKRIAEEARKPLKDFGFAGNKDRKAVTAQYISVFRGSPSLQDLSLADISLTFKGFSLRKIALGDLEGNSFTITIRNIDGAGIERIKKFEKENKKTPSHIPNYFGPQRFSSANHLIGKALVTKDFRNAIGLVLQHDNEHSSRAGMSLKENPNNTISALRLLPASTLRMYVHAYQSSLFNTLLHHLLAQNPAPLLPTIPLLPIIGFGTEIGELESHTQEAANELLQQEGVSPRDFINRQMPELSSEGGMRAAFFTAPDFRITGIGEDECFAGREKATVEFTLKKSCYATVLLSYLLEGFPDAPDDLP